MIKFFISRVVKWATSLSWEQFLLIIGAVKNAAQQWPKRTDMSEATKLKISLERAQFVSDMITATFPGTPTKAVNLLREIAVMWISLKGK